jgi:GNAT superfamily N-acetyltransferase
MIDPNITLGYLANNQAVMPVIKDWFAEEWPEHYGKDGPGDITTELLVANSATGLPITLLAFYDEEPAAVIALLDESVETHKHLHPWVGLLLVAPEYRKKGIGNILVSEIEDLATGFGALKLYAGTNSANTLLKRRDWKAIDTGPCHLGAVTVYEKEL